MENTELQLIVKEKTMGTLVTNAREIKEWVKNRLAEYTPDKYEGDIATAKKDKAELVKAADRLNSGRIELEKEFMKPFQEFKDVVKETTDLIKTASNAIDVIIKAREEEEKAEKKRLIEDTWRAKEFNLVPLEKIFNPRWLNKTTKFSAIDAEIDTIIHKINDDLETLGKFGEDTAKLKDIYLTTLNLQATLSKGAELKANRERLAEMEAKKALAEKETEKNEENNQKTIFKNEKIVENRDCPVDNIDTNSEPLYKVNILCDKVNSEVIEKILKDIKVNFLPAYTVSMTAEQAETFKRILAGNGIGYKKEHLLTLDV